MNADSAVPGLNRNAVHALRVRVPDEREQRTIAQVLGTLDDKIELNWSMNQTLEELAQTLFKSWFVNFDPVRAKMEGRDTRLSKQISNLFPNSLDDDGIPYGWEVSEIGKEVNVVGGATPSTKELSYWKGGKLHWATPKDLSRLSSPVLLDTDRKITDEGMKKISSGLLPTGTVLLSSRAPVGYLAIAEVPTAVNQGFIAMVCEKRIPNIYVLFWCYQQLNFIRGISDGSTFPEISKKMFRPIPVVVPPKQVLSTYMDIVSPLYNRIVANLRESVFLAQLRDILLPQLMSGEITLTNQIETMNDIK